jgi:lysophospholipase L1-like esterase
VRKNILYLFLSIAIITTCIYLGYEAVRIHELTGNGAAMSLSTEKFERRLERENGILILGDSLAYGVGASSQEASFAGKIAEHYHDSAVNNKAKIGETVDSLKETIDEKITDKYEIIFIIVGGNDIMRMHINIFNSANSIKPIIDKASRHSARVVLVTTGNFNYVSLQPWILKSIFNNRANILRRAALKLETNYPNYSYIDFYTTSMDEEEYKSYEASDGYHLNDAGVNRLITITMEHIE